MWFYSIIGINIPWFAIPRGKSDALGQGIHNLDLRITPLLIALWLQFETTIRLVIAHLLALWLHNKSVNLT